MSLSMDLAQSLNPGIRFYSQTCLHIRITGEVWKNSHARAPTTRESDIIGPEASQGIKIREPVFYTMDVPTFIKTFP